MQKSVLAAATLALLLVPAVAFGAGFAKQSLFLSRSSVTEGETVLIHAVISSESSFSGTLDFTDAGAAIGSVPVKLAAGEAQAVSVSWKPAAGSHSIAAELKSGSTVVEKQSATFSVNPKPQPAASSAPTSTAQAAAVESSQQIQDGIAGISPQAAGVTAPFFKLVDGGRDSAANIVADQLAKTKAALGTDAGKVLGAEATKNAASNPGGTLWYILQTLYLYLLTILGFVINSAAIFYPLLAAVVLFLLWKLVNRFRRPAY